jgi:HPt (histidine-containing phosphotransfer) domain-containing protein
MDAYLTKPITGRKLIEAVERLAGRAKPPQAAPPQAEPPQAAPPPDTPPPVSPEPPELAIEVFDREAARVSLGGRDNLLQEMTAFFFEDAPRRLAEIQAGLRDQSPSAIARAAHRLNGTLVYLGAKPAWQAAHRVEQAGSAGDLTQAASAIQILTGQIARLDAALRSWCEGQIS